MITIAICEDESYFSDSLNEMVIDATVIIFTKGEELL